MYAKNELMFPQYAIAFLRDARGKAWCDLVDRVAALPETHEEVLAFMLMMVRVNGCMPCETDSYRAMRGCTACALQTLRRFKDSDEDLLRMFQDALADVQGYLIHAQPVKLRGEVMAESV
jgi:hypothetical protein